MRENIVFHQRWDPRLYQQAIEAACLGPDLAQLPAGDLTELGESVRLSSASSLPLNVIRCFFPFGRMKKFCPKLPDCTVVYRSATTYSISLIFNHQHLFVFLSSVQM